MGKSVFIIFIGLFALSGCESSLQTKKTYPLGGLRIKSSTPRLAGFTKGARRAGFRSRGAGRPSGFSHRAPASTVSRSEHFNGLWSSFAPKPKMNLRRGPAGCDNLMNHAILKEIEGMPSRGGYGGKGKGVPVYLGDHRIPGSTKGNYCSKAVYTVLLNAASKSSLNPFRNMTPKQRENFYFKHPDNIGFWGLQNNNYGGVSDANLALPFGSEIDSLSQACPGDLMKYDRKNGTGHSVVYLGKEGNKICYWSSQGSTGGYGKKCESLSGIERMKIIRPDKVQNLQYIAEFQRPSSSELRTIRKNLSDRHYRSKDRNIPSMIADNIDPNMLDHAI